MYFGGDVCMCVCVSVRVPLVEVFHPWVGWEGLDLDLRVRPAVAGGVPKIWESGNLGILSLSDRDRKSKFSNCLGHNR